MRTFRIVCLLVMVYSLCSCHDDYRDELDYGDEINLGRDCPVRFDPIEDLSDTVSMFQFVDSFYVDSLNNGYSIGMMFLREYGPLWCIEPDRGESVFIYTDFCDSIAKGILPLIMADPEKKEMWSDMHYFYAGVGSGACIYADRELFGCPAGTNLGAFFEYSSYPLKPNYSIRRYPTFAQIHYPDGKLLGICDDPATSYTFNDIFTEGAMLYCSAYLRLNVPVDEGMDGATLSVEIPLEGELLKKAVFGHDYLLPYEYFKSQYYKHRTIKGSLQVHLPK